jgi:hypothetical protein
MDKLIIWMYLIPSQRGWQSGDTPNFKVHKLFYPDLDIQSYLLALLESLCKSTHIFNDKVVSSENNLLWRSFYRVSPRPLSLRLQSFSIGLASTGTQLAMIAVEVTVREEKTIELPVNSPVEGVLEELVVSGVEAGREYSDKSLFRITSGLLDCLDQGLLSFHLQGLCCVIKADILTSNISRSNV